MRVYLVAFGIVLLSLVSFCGGCETNSPPNRNPATGKVVFVLFDISSSTGAEGVRKQYFEGFKRIVGRVGSGDTVVADVITDNPLAQSTFPVNESFEKPSFNTDNPLIVNSGLKKHEEGLRVRRDKIAHTTDAILSDSSRKINQTRILDSMQLAERVFNTYNRPSKVLVIFSDMIEESDRYNFQKQKVTEAGIANILKEEKQKGRLPNLKGVKVYVVGAGASNYKQPPASSFGEVQNFWVRYFKEVGADLTKDRYGAALLSFEE